MDACLLARQIGGKEKRRGEGTIGYLHGDVEVVDGEVVLQLKVGDALKG